MKPSFLCSEADKVRYRKILYLDKLQQSQGSHRVDDFFDEQRGEIKKGLIEDHGEGFNYDLWLYEMEALVNLRVKKDLWEELVAYEARSEENLKRRKFKESFFFICGYIDPKSDEVISKDVALKVVEDRLKDPPPKGAKVKTRPFNSGWIFSSNDEVFAVGIHGQVVSVLPEATTEEIISQFNKIFR